MVYTIPRVVWKTLNEIPNLLALSLKCSTSCSTGPIYLIRFNIVIIECLHTIILIFTPCLALDNNTSSIVIHFLSSFPVSTSPKERDNSQAKILIECCAKQIH